MTWTAEGLEALKLGEMYGAVVLHMMKRPDLHAAIREGGEALEKHKAWWYELGVILDAWGRKCAPPSGVPRHRARIRFGQQDEDLGEEVTVKFFTQAELDAYMTGVEESNGWMSYTVLSDTREPACPRCGVHLGEEAHTCD